MDRGRAEAGRAGTGPSVGDERGGGGHQKGRGGGGASAVAERKAGSDGGITGSE